MHPTTPGLTDRVRRARDLPAQLDLLRDAYRGENCVVVTCGPSLSMIPTDRLQRALESTLVLSVKQAVHATGAETDVVCFNSFNVARFKTASPATLRLLVREPTGRIPQLNRADVVMRQSTDVGDLARSLAATANFDAYPLAAETPRPWGPGIIYEVVLHLALHLGVARITTLGWDIANPQGRNTHFYDSAQDNAFFQRDREHAFTMAAARSRLPPVVKRVARSARALVAHVRGTVYNRAVPVEGETEIVSASTAAANRWLVANGVTLEVVTPSAHLHPEIQRLTVEDFFDRAGV
jgi:hypothetical protein